MSKYDYMVVGAGLFGATFAQQAAEAGKRVLVIERRSNVAGNAHCDMIEGIQVHRYGPHIFHTKDRRIWDYINRFGRFNRYIHTPIAACQDGMYNIPFNMNTFSQLWGVRTPDEARRELQRQIDREQISEPRNFEEQCLQRFGRDLYEWLIKEYVEKQYGKPCSELPLDALRIQPPCFTYNNRFFPGEYEGIPLEGYDVLVKRMLAGCDLMLNTDFNGFGRGNPDIANRIIYTGMIDEYFLFKRGTLGYRTVRYETSVLDIPDYQGVAIVDHMTAANPATRTIEHKHFLFGQQPKTVITREYPAAWNSTMEPFFPIRDDKNLKLYNSYRALSVTQLDVLFCGRLATYQYYNMDETIRAALDLAAKELKR